MSYADGQDGGTRVMNEEDAKKSTRFGLSRNVLAMSAVSFLNDLSSDMIFPFIPVFLTSVLGASTGFVGIVEGIADATASIGKLISGRTSDWWHRRKPFILAGYTLSAIAKPLLALAASPWHVLAVRFLDRTGKGVRDAPRDALISFSTEKKTAGRAFGFHRAADTLGAALGPVIAFLILPQIHNNLRILFLLSFVASAMAVIILSIFVREVMRPRDSVSPPASSSPMIRPARAWRSLGTPFFIFLAAGTVFSLGRASDAFLILRAKDIGIALALLPIPYVASNLAFVFTSTPVGILSDRMGHRNTFMIGMLGLSLVYFLFARAMTPAAIWMLFLAYGCVTAFTEGVARAIVTDLVSEDVRGTAFGMYHAFTGFALLPASLVFGWLWQYFGSAAAFRYSAALVLAAFVIFLFLRMTRR